MKTFFLKLLSAALCLVLLCGCASNSNTDQESADNGAPVVDTDGSNDTQIDDTATVPDESGDDSGASSEGEDTDPGFTTLTSEELAQWESYFNNWENNGLLRFPYSDLENDPDQLAPYLAWLFYDIGDMESEFSEEEFALLAETDLWLKLDAHRLTRDFINTYLFEKMNVPAEKTENLLDAADLGVYLLQYDAWYMSHGDCAFSPYTFKSGASFADGTVKLFYFNDFLSVAQEDGEMDYIDVEMIVTLAPREDGTWYIVSHEIDRSTWDE